MYGPVCRITMKPVGLMLLSSALSALAAEPVPNAALPADHLQGGTNKWVAKADRATVTEKDREWWAFQPLKRVEPPTGKASQGGRSAIDSFILARLEEKKLTPNPAADRRTLIRRASFDLLGLPP